MKTTRILVVSDLHLGGMPATAAAPALQMCTERGRERLAAFFEWVAGTADPGLRLVLAGDVVDFLSENRPDGFSAFTPDEDVGIRKLKAIFGDREENEGVSDEALRNTRAVWTQLAAVVRSGVAVTILLGNHDIELSLPGPRRLLLERLGPGRVEFLYDNEALSIGSVLVEHGNRYDDWNAVPHDSLRHVRSQLSRREPAQFEPLPGSIIVRDLVNVLKPRLGFVDLLKPETAALLPFLALLAPDEYRRIAVMLRQRIRAARVRYAADGAPVDPNYVAKVMTAPVYEAVPGVAASTGDRADDELLSLADSLALGGDPGAVAAGRGFLETWKATITDGFRNAQLTLLLKGLKAWSGANLDAFDPAKESATYVTPALEAAARGFDVIVYGHTHLPKRVPLKGMSTADGRTVKHDAVYLNTGTWADLMAVPRTITQGNGDEARAALKAFAQGLAANDPVKGRALLPTFADVRLDAAGHVASADVLLFESAARQTPISAELVRAELERAHG